MLGRITCQEDKTFPDYGYCASSKEGDPRYAGEWLRSKPGLWAVSAMLDAPVPWVDCKLLKKPLIRTSRPPKVVGFHCRYDDNDDLWFRHYVPGGGNGIAIL